MNLSNKFSSLETTLESPGKGSAKKPNRVFQKRIHNINWIKSLNRKGLNFEENENLILIHTTTSNEKLYIQYPGKETISRYPKPWDFRPKVFDGKVFLEDLTFFNIWEVLTDKLSPLIKNNDNLINVLSTVFYRMAFMSDHHIDENASTYLGREIINKSKSKESVSKTDLQNFYLYSPDKKVISYISEFLSDLKGMSFEAFLHYNDLLAWNEDCKYCYKKKCEFEFKDKLWRLKDIYEDDKTKPRTWMTGTGRVNTILTHLRIIGFIKGEIKFSEILSSFSSMRGVSPAKNPELLKLCSPYVKSK